MDNTWGWLIKMCGDGVGKISHSRQLQQSDMLPGSSPSGRSSKFLKRCARGVKEVFAPRGKAPDAYASSSQPQPQPLPSGSPSQLAPIHELLPQPPAQPKESTLSSQLVTSAGESAPTTNLVAVNEVQLANAEPTPALAANKIGAVAWSRLRAALGLVVKSANVFPPLKAAMADFLGVLDIFEVSHYLCICACHLNFCLV